MPLLVFDEIDANVGGEIAHAVAAKMRSLGERHQVLCITHLPQVAALAAAHYVVTKEFTEERTYSRMSEVKTKARVKEIARMLGGQGESATALAKTMLRRQIQRRLKAIQGECVLIVWRALRLPRDRAWLANRLG